ncbi:OpgC domain-containing protein [Azospirillum sp. SYSU D00513]|uniref:OpgC family protein n=1 Tax=Azospirillum sp. SYSU D00513 TaxID=2812561 RepID=UPI001A96DF49|nr:OpgC domain-containing protein [Azospirillum sp. SYSU D00513]
MNRSDVLDGLRGYFLVFMMVNHFVVAGGVLLAKLNHAEFGFVQDAQGFVFLSGLVAGLYYARVYTQRSPAAARQRLWSRAIELYLYTVGVIAIVTAAIALIPGAAEPLAGFLGHLSGREPGTILAALLLLHSPTFTDLLIQYILYLAATPFLLRLILNGHARTVAFGSVAAWASVQTGLHLPFLAAIDALLGGMTPGLAVRGPFNPLAWQILYVSGLLAGCAVQRGTFDAERWFPVARPPLLVPALVTVLACACWHLALANGLVGPAVEAHFLRHVNRTEFSLVYLANFAALAYVIAWLLIAGHRSDHPVAAWTGQFLHRLFTLPFLRLLGRHSLHVYLFHVLVSYAVLLLDLFFGPFGETTKTMLLLSSITSLAIPALLRERWNAPKLPQRSRVPAS